MRYNMERFYSSTPSQSNGREGRGLAICKLSTAIPARNRTYGLKPLILAGLCSPSIAPYRGIATSTNKMTMFLNLVLSTYIIILIFCWQGDAKLPFNLLLAGNIDIFKNKNQNSFSLITNVRPQEAGPRRGHNTTLPSSLRASIRRPLHGEICALR
jgi:hypothetical protein